MVDLVIQLRTLVGHNGARDDGTRHTAGTTQGNLRRHKHVGNVLVFTQERNVENDFQGLRIGSHHNEGGLSSIQSLGR